MGIHYNQTFYLFLIKLFIENGVNEEDNKHIKMGASNNPNAARLAALQERKQSIEEALAKRNQELRQLCIQVSA